jgi:hypothetical protein
MTRKFWNWVRNEEPDSFGSTEHSTSTGKFPMRHGSATKSHPSYSKMN